MPTKYETMGENNDYIFMFTMNMIQWKWVSIMSALNLIITLHVLKHSNVQISNNYQSQCNTNTCIQSK
jgi:hypothetical protein